MLVAGSELIEDIRKAPDDVLSMTEPTNEVRQRAKRSGHTHEDCLVHSTRIHARLIEHERYIPLSRRSFQINAEYCGYFQGGPRRARHGYGGFHPDAWRWCVANSWSKRPWLTGNAEWVKVSILRTLERVICRTTNRIFVGVPLCS